MGVRREQHALTEFREADHVLLLLYSLKPCNISTSWTMPAVTGTGT